MKKWGLLCADFHCGHLVGLTPPEYQHKYTPGSITKRNKYYKISTALWGEFVSILNGLPELDFIGILGDLIEGKGKKSGGTELITSSMEEQSNMAIKIINKIRIKSCKKGAKFILTTGTDYHTSSEGDEWENVIAKTAKVDKIGAHEWIEINGLVIDIKHHIGASSVPHGRATAILRDALWNDLWAIEKMQPMADLVVRAHVHYYISIETSRKRAMTLPALQGMGSRYGAKRCSGLIDWGVVLLEINDKNDYIIHPIIRPIISQKARVMKL